MSIYNGLSGAEANLESSYALLNLAGQVATKVYRMHFLFYPRSDYHIKDWFPYVHTLRIWQI